MQVVEPRVYLLAETKLYDGPKLYGLPVTIEDNPHPASYTDWLKDLDALEVLPNLSGTDPEALIELAARRCYKSFKPGLNPNVNKVRTDSKEYHRNILSSRHGSVLEHATCTWAFEYVSRVFTHELVRNRSGAA